MASGAKRTKRANRANTESGKTGQKAPALMGKQAQVRSPPWAFLPRHMLLLYRAGKYLAGGMGSSVGSHGKTGAGYGDPVNREEASFVGQDVKVLAVLRGLGLLGK